jgi:Flp pilus assembly pilin Flp
MNKYKVIAILCVIVMVGAIAWNCGLNKAVTGLFDKPATSISNLFNDSTTNPGL